MMNLADNINQANFLFLTGAIFQLRKLRNIEFESWIFGSVQFFKHVLNYILNEWVGKKKSDSAYIRALILEPNCLSSNPNNFP